jgi:hypothetical protein
LNSMQNKFIVNFLSNITLYSESLPIQ